MKRLSIIICACLFITLSWLLVLQESDDIYAQKWHTRPIAKDSKTVAVWISYIDLQEVFSSYKQQTIDEIYENLVSIGVTDVFLQVTAFGDALWESKIYPSSELTVYSSCGIPENFLEDFLDTAKNNSINVHAWMNPLRLYSGDSPDYQPFLHELQANGILADHSGSVFLDPSSRNTDELLKAAIYELLELGFAGVHFDDYFYPTTETSFDSAAFEKYIEKGGTASLEEFRRQNIDRIVTGCYRAVKQKKPDAVFGVSPDASIERCFDVHYCDVVKWCAESGYIDYICPQIYYGFCNESLPFEDVLNEWLQVSCNKKLLIGLAFSKVGKYDEYAGNGAEEWENSDDVIARQTEAALNAKECAGISLFRYGSMFSSPESQNAVEDAELENLKEALGMPNE